MTTSSVASNPYADLGLALKKNEGSNAGSSKLGQDSFLKLLTAQLQNQDPMKPLDNSAFLGQLAQISTVSGIQSLQDSFDSLSTSMGSYQTLQAAQLVGHKVLGASEQGYLGSDGSLGGAARLTSAAQLKVDVVDGSGQIVRTLDLGTQAAGLTHFSWDGASATGERMPAGVYTFKAHASGSDGNTALSTYAVGEVEGIQLDAGKVTLDLKGLDPVALSDITQIF